MIQAGLYNLDCMDAMKEFPDKFFDLAIVDPPYGLNIARMAMGAGKSPSCPKIQNRQWEKADWDKAPDDEYFTELSRVSNKRIIWGGELLQFTALQMLSNLGQRRWNVWPELLGV